MSFSNKYEKEIDSFDNGQYKGYKLIDFCDSLKIKINTVYHALKRGESFLTVVNRLVNLVKSENQSINKTELKPVEEVKQVVEEPILEEVKIELEPDRADDKVESVEVKENNPTSYESLIALYDNGKYAGLNLRQFSNLLKINYSTLRKKYQKTKDFNKTVDSLIESNKKKGIVIEQNDFWYRDAIDTYKDGIYKGYSISNFCKAVKINESKFYRDVKRYNDLETLLKYNKIEKSKTLDIKPLVDETPKKLALSESYLLKGLSSIKEIPFYNRPGYSRKPLCNPNDIIITKEEKQRYLNEVYEYGPNHCYKNYDMKLFCDMMGIYYDYFVYNFKKGKSIKEIIAHA